MRLLLLLCLSVMLSTTCLGTTIYEIRYKFDNSPIEYTAFMVRYDNSTGFMRVRYSTNGGVVVVDMKFTEVLEKRAVNGEDAESLRFQGENPVFILNTAGSKSYTPDYLWFKKGSADKYFVPWGATSPHDDGSTLQGKILDIKLLNTPDITESYANLFFGKTEAFYRNLFQPRDDVAGTAGGTLHLVVVANTKDADIGSTCLKDIQRVKSKFDDVASVLGFQTDYVEVSGPKFGKTGLLSALQDMNSGSNDIVVVCYTGHGFHYNNDNSNMYPQFDLTTNSFDDLDKNTLSLSEVYNLLQKKTGRLKILLADCCNSYIRESRPIARSNPACFRSRVQWSKENCRALFLNSSGIVIANAASPGEVAFCNSDIGGYFLYNFIETLDKSLSVFQSNVNWGNILSETRSSVLKMTTNMNCDRTTCAETMLSYTKFN